jgi:hypothetical protein
MPKLTDELGKDVTIGGNIPQHSAAPPVLQIDPLAQSMTHGGVGMAKTPMTKTEQSTVPASILEGLGKWARNEIPASKVRTYLPQGWTVDRRLNTLSVGIGVYDPNGKYHFISNGDF